MEIGQRDAFDLALVIIGLICVYSYFVDPSGPQTAIGALLDALLSVPQSVYLVLFGAATVLFLVYLLLIVPRTYQ